MENVPTLGLQLVVLFWELLGMLSAALIGGGRSLRGSLGKLQRVPSSIHHEVGGPCRMCFPAVVFGLTVNL